MKLIRETNRRYRRVKSMRRGWWYKPRYTRRPCEGYEIRFYHRDLPLIPWKVYRFIGRVHEWAWDKEEHMLRKFVVLYEANDSDFDYDPPLAFVCMAENGDHAEEQCENAYPEAKVLWIYENDQITEEHALVEAAYQDYWGPRILGELT